ncbi:rhomboid family intramembrane serine protease [Paracoccus caeni]|uniref:Rhomboid family intramembrane serine protease n=1 Tax=Paracoccus caeni TaxID=657651 RepID=A0A934W226_9RHOB|nr:rhomboid family intramembrane serine protease [Paracoccus caeni]MBK4217983.1 rhomboid family intramembrane serine protease [Paracoccus caeni]
MTQYPDRMTTIPRVRRRQLPVWVVAVIAICCAVEVVILLTTLLGYTQARAIGFFIGGFWSQLLWSGGGLYVGQPVLMFLTYGLLHSGLMHLTMNMISLAVVGRELNRMIGSSRMAVIYILSQIGAGLVFALLEPETGPMVGASGAIFGLAGALVGYAAVSGYRRGREMGQMWRSVLLLLVLNVALTFLMPEIAWQAHLGGAIVGLVAGVMLAMRVPQRR